MQILRTVFLSALVATTASAQADSYARTEGGALDVYELLVSNFEVGQPESPKILVRFENPFRGTILRDSETGFAVEWTANGELQSPDLSQSTRCLSRSPEIWCTARTNWFRPPPGASGQRTFVHPNEFSQGFYFFNLEYDTRYCVRFQATALAPRIVEVTNPAPWSRWTCVRTPVAPPPIPLPPAPLRPNVTILPATDGVGVLGGPLPVRALIEWEVLGASSVNFRYRIERAWLDAYTPKWEQVAADKGTNQGEVTLPFEAGREPSDERRFLFRVCTENSAGRACSPARATSPLPPAGPLAPKSGRKVEFPTQPGATTSTTAEGADTRAATPRVCEIAKVARARNSPAAPGLEAQCIKAGGQVAPSQPQAKTSTAPTPLKAQGRVRLDAPAAAAGEVAASATALPSTVVRQPENTIDVRVRYSKALGYKGSTSAFGKIGETSCSAFIVSAALSESGERQRNPIPISSDFTMQTAGDYYVCNYRVAEIPIGQPVTVNVSVADPDRYTRWEGGAAAVPPTGQWRTIVDPSRTSELNSVQPRARLSFDMVYGPVSQR